MNTYFITSRSSQSGAALFIGTILLAIASITAVVSMRTTTTQERITSNQRNKTVSLMAAESGATQIMQRLTNTTTPGIGNILCGFPTQPSNAFRLEDGSGGAWHIRPVANSTPSNRCSTDPTGTGLFNVSMPDPMNSNLSIITLEIVGLAFSNDGSSTNSIQLAESVIQLEIRDETTSTTSGGDSSEILFASNIRVNGGLDITGNGHATGSWNLTGSCPIRGSSVLSSGSNAQSSSAGCLTRQENRGRNLQIAGEVNRPLPPLVNERYASLIPGTGFTTCNPANFVNNQTYLCNNNITISNRLTGVTIITASGVNVTVNADLIRSTIISQGNLTVGSNISLGTNDDPRNLVNLAATGNFLVNGGGRTNIVGNVYADGAVRRNGGGQSVIVGSVMSRGEMDWNGNLTISGPTSPGPGGSGDTESTSTRTILRWQEVTAI